MESPGIHTRAGGGFSVLWKIWRDALFCPLRLPALYALRQRAALREYVAFYRTFLPAAHLPYSARVLPDPDPRRFAVPAGVFAAAALGRTGAVLHVPYGLFQSHLQTTQRALLDAGNRVAILHVSTAPSPGNAPDRLAGQTGLSPAHDRRLYSGPHRLGHFHPLCWQLLYTASCGNSADTSLRTQRHPARDLWRQREVSRRFWRGNAALSVFCIRAASLHLASLARGLEKAESLALWRWLALPAFYDHVEL